MLYAIALALSLVSAAPSSSPRLFRAKDGTLEVLLDVTEKKQRAVFRIGTGERVTIVRANVRAEIDEVGRATDYHLSEGDWVIHVPDSPHPRGLAIGGPPRLIDPETGRTELVEVNDPSDFAEFKTLLEKAGGVLRSILPKPKPSAPEAPVRPPTAGNHSAAMIHFLLPDTPEVAEKLKVFEDESNERRPAHFTFNDKLGDGQQREITMWTARSAAPILAARIFETFGATTRIRQRLLDDEDYAREPEKFAPEATPLTYRALAFGRDLDALETGRKVCEGTDAAQCLHHHIVETERLLKQIRDVGHRLAMYSHSSMAKEDLDRDFQAPLVALMARGFEAIHDLEDGRGVDEMLHGWPEVFGFPQTYLARRIKSGEGTYFDHWIMTLQNAMDDVPHEIADAGSKSKHVERYLALGVYPLRLVDVLHVAGRPYSTWPVFALALSIGDKARDQLLQLIRDASKMSEKVHQALAHEDVDGGVFVARLLEAIVTGAERSYEQNYARFSFRPAPYYARAASLFSELLEDGRFYLKNRATYLLVLSNARRLILAIESDYPYGDGTGTNDDENPAPSISTELSRLKNAFAVDQARLVHALTMKCTAALSPR